MSVLIKGLTIPTVGVRHCVIAFDNNRLLITDVCGNSIFDGNYVEIPTPHGRLIDADELFCEIDGIKGWDYGDESDMAISAAEALSAIDDSPTVIEAEVSE